MRLEYNAPEIQWRTEMKVVILAGGLGTRISEESHLKPKPMIEIGETHIVAYHEVLFGIRIPRIHYLSGL